MAAPEAKKAVDDAFAQICPNRHPGPVCTASRYWDGCARLLPADLLNDLLDEKV
ncbi:hypothetical protein [Actinopolymorpha pittospori]|uniref:Uncharacterized protein n=1 Tax=Actinopolymorpha pittospori TaxID=648752 RepID=A0A927MYB4_9ACTN|nr:hypothetical protein [Actinopolymorpha pittospori]MBE1606958.1 hypothetical protein [Actinopolymorpha pittospori]